jgi:hypothetical protein
LVEDDHGHDLGRLRAGPEKASGDAAVLALARRGDEIDHVLLRPLIRKPPWLSVHVSANGLVSPR